MEFSIIVPIFNRQGYSKVCLDALAAHTDLQAAEVIIVDNGSIGPTKRLLESYPQFQLIVNEKNLGAPVAQNQGIKAAKGDYLVFLHNDCIVTSEWMAGLRATADALEKSKAIKLASPYTNYSDEATFVYSKEMKQRFAKHKLNNKFNPTSEEVKAALDATYRPYGGLETFAQQVSKLKPPLERVDEISAFCLIAKRALFAQIGQFEEIFKFRGYEDKDLTARILHMKNEVGRAGFFVHHWGNITSDGPGFCWPDLMRINRDIYNSFVKSYAGIQVDEKWTALVFPDSLHPELTDRLLTNLQTVKNPPTQIIRIPDAGIFPERKAWEWALPQIEHEFVMHLDSDMLLKKSTSDVLMQNFSNPSIGCVAGLLEDPCVGIIGHLRLWRTRVIRQVMAEGEINDAIPDTSVIQTANRLGWQVQFINDVVGEHAVVLDAWNIFRMYFRRGLKQKARGRIGTPAGTWGIDGALKTGTNWSHLALLGYHCGIMNEYGADPHDTKFDEFAYEQYQKIKSFAESLVDTQPELPDQEQVDGRINVALICDSLEIGGMEMFVKMFDQFVDKSKYNVFVYSRIGGPLAEDLTCKIRLAPGPSEISSGKIFKWLCDDRIHVSILITYSKAAKIFANGKVCRIIERLDGAHVVLLNDPKLSNVVVFQSQKLEEMQADNYKGIRHAMICNGRDLEKFKPDPDSRAELRKRLGLTPEDVLFCNIGRLHPIKHQTNLVELAGELRNRGHTNFKIAIMGPDQGEGAVLEKLITSRSLQKHIVIMSGSISGTAALYSASDVYIQSSRTEGLSGSLLESLAAGLPIVATNVGATADVVNEENGILVPPLELTPMVDAAERLFDSALRAKMTECSFEKAKRYCAREMIKNYEVLISEEYEAGLKEIASLPPTTVLIPVYKRHEYLDKAIESVLAQTSDKWRLVIAVDTLTPTPEIKEILARYDDPRISHVMFEHKNQCSALNNAVRQVRTVYSTRLDSDDLLSPNAIETLNRYVAEYPDVGYFYSSRKHIEANGTYIDRKDEAEDFSPIRSEQWYIGRAMVTWKNSDFLRCGGFAEDIVYGEDYLLMLMMMLHRTKFMPIKQQLYLIRNHEASRISSSHSTHEQKFYVNLVRERYLKFKKLMRISWTGEDPSTMQPRMRIPGEV